MSTITSEARNEKPVAINMRANISKRNLIDVAAALMGRDRTGFILEAACHKVKKVTMDKQIFMHR